MTTFDSVGTDQDLWHVEVAPDDVRIVTLDQLDEAFQGGLVNESMRVWQEGMPCAVSLGELLGGEDDEPQSEHTPVHWGQSEYSPQQQAEVQYATPEYARAEYVPPQYPPSQYPPPRYEAHYAAPQAVPPRSAPPPSRAPESAWPPVVAHSQTPPPVSSWSAPPSAPVSMAPMALDVPDFDVAYPRSGGKGKWLLAAFVVAAIGGAVVFQTNNGKFGSASTVQAAAVQAPAPPPQPVSHTYNPGPAVKLGESKPPVALTVREPDKKEADVKKLDELKADSKLDAKKVMASGKKPKAAPRTRSSAPSKPKASGFKLGKSGSKYNPLNGSL